jgi:hypothetical protein
MLGFLAGLAGEAAATVQPDTLCMSADSEFAVRCPAAGSGACLLADGARPVRSPVGKIHVKVIVMEPVVVRPQHRGELRACPVVYCAQERTRLPVAVPALLY